MLKLLSAQDQPCDVEMKSRGICWEKTGVQVCQKQPLAELVYGPFKERSGWAPLGGPRVGLCLKTTRSNLLQDADISRSCAGGQVGSRLPFTRCEIKTAWADPAGSRGGRRQRGEKERRREENNLQQMHTLFNLQCIRTCFYPAFKFNLQSWSGASTKKSENDHIQDKK